MTVLLDVLITLGLVGTFGVLFVVFMRFHRATDTIDRRPDAGDDETSMMFSSSDFGACDSGDGGCN